MKDHSVKSKKKNSTRCNIINTGQIFIPIYVDFFFLIIIFMSGMNEFFEHYCHRPRKLHVVIFPNKSIKKKNA